MTDVQQTIFQFSFGDSEDIIHSNSIVKQSITVDMFQCSFAACESENYDDNKRAVEEQMDELKEEMDEDDDQEVSVPESKQKC